jgi:YD repeat-containing protein
VFVAAENGRPGEEQWWKGQRRLETYFYYYDEQHRLTDIARFNKRAQRILPDLLFEYHPQGWLAKQVSVQANSNQYRTYRYSYDARGLKVKEEILNKQNQIEAVIFYTYL